MLVVDESFHFTSRQTTLISHNKTKSQKSTDNIDIYSYGGLRSNGVTQRFKVESNLIEEEEVLALDDDFIRIKKVKSDHGSTRGTVVEDNSIDVADVEGATSMADKVVVEIPASQTSFMKLSHTARHEASASTVSIRHATFNDLTSIINLRLKVFYPYLMKDSAFHSKLLYKVRQRFDRGSICLIASMNNNNNNNNNNNLNGHPHHITMTIDQHHHLSVNQRMNSLLPVGTVELNDFDFRGTSMETVGSPRKLYVADLAVREDCRRMGVATALLTAVEVYATNALYDAIYLHVETNNEAGVKLYLNNGYEIYQATPQSIHFTETHLQRPANLYVMLYKRLFL